MTGNLDSGATSHFLPVSYKGGKEELTADGITVETATPGATIQSTATDVIKWQNVKRGAKECYKFPDNQLSEPLRTDGTCCFHYAT